MLAPSDISFGCDACVPWRFSASSFAGHCGGNHADMKDDKKHSEADHKAAETKAETSEAKSESES